jgi:hypothetical protein
MAVKRHKLELAMEEDFCLLGVVADEPDYKLCWMINQALDMNFEKQEDLQLYHRKRNEEQVFSLFSYYDPDALITYRIIRNKSENGYFLDELKNIDYLIHIQGEIHADRITYFMLSVNSLQPVRMCVPSDLSRIKYKERLFIW